MMQSNTPQRLQDTNAQFGFPQHVSDILNPGGCIKCTEIMCRLIHVCMIEAGFIPVIGEEPSLTLEQASNTLMAESVPLLIRRLQEIIDKTGNLHSLMYRCIVEEEVKATLQPHLSSSNSNIEALSTVDKLTVRADLPTLKESGDGSILAPDKQEISEMASYTPHASRWRNVYSENVSVSIVHDNFDIFVVANGPGFHKNAQLSVTQYLRPKESLPATAKVEEYLKIMNFSAVRFADDVKRKFCYEIMDEINGLSFDIRSLSLLPREIIMEIAKRCSSVSVLRLRSTCSEIHSALSSSNVMFWKMMLKKDFPHYNHDNLKSDVSPEKYFRKYSDMYRLTFQPLRRSFFGRNFPYYMY